MAADWTTPYLQLISDCEKRESRLTEWERNFVQSVREQLEDNPPVPLSPKQSEKLDQIWEKATEKG